MTSEYRQGKAKGAGEKPRRIAEAALEYIAGREAAAAVSTISSKNQITLPAHLLREIGLKPGDRLAVSREGTRLVLRPRPRDWVGYYAGSLRGLYGGTREEMDAYVRDLRQNEERERSIEEAWAGQRPASTE